MTSVIRRAAVSGGVVAALGGGALSVVAAAAYLPAHDPNSVPKTGPLTQTIQAEQQRSATLSQRLTDVQRTTAELEAALAQAQQDADVESSMATALRAQLDAARARIAALERAASAVPSGWSDPTAGARATARPTATPPRTVATTGASGATSGSGTSGETSETEDHAGTEPGGDD